MRNFDVLTESDVTVTSSPPPAVTEQVRVASAGRTYLIAGDWGWREVRDYVVEQAEQRWGPQSRPPVVKEAAIFKGFVKRWGTTAEMVARYIFERCDGMVNGRRVKVTDFTSAADPRIAEPIAEVLNR